MEASTSGSGSGAPTARRRGGMARWLHASGGRSDGRGDAFVEELEAEVALLREENARLRTRHEHGGGRPREKRTGELPPALADADDPVAGSGQRRDDDASELLTECRVLRTTLLDACSDVERAMREIRGRLDQLEALEQLQRLARPEPLAQPERQPQPGPPEATAVLAPEPRASAER